MKKQNKFKKMKLPSLSKGTREAIMAKAYPAVIVLIFIVVSFLLVKAFLYRSDYFKFRFIEARDAVTGQRINLTINNQLLNMCGGANVFHLDLKAISDFVSSHYPDAKDVAVTIMPPDKLGISMKFRKSIAIVRGSKNYAIDEDGVILFTQDANALKDLPFIDGVNIKNYERSSRKIVSQNLKLALYLLKELKNTRIIQAYGIQEINAADGSNISFYLKNGIEAKMGNENFSQRLGLLWKTLKDPRMVLDKISYIDLRYKDVVVGPR